MHTISEKVKFIERAFGRADLGRDAVNIAVKCPNPECTSVKKKLAIRVADDYYNCWVCGIRGRSLVPLLKKYSTFALFSEYTEKYYDDYVITPELCDDDFALQLPRNFKLLALNRNSKHPLVNKAIRYLASRGIDERDLWYFKFGVSDDNTFNERVMMPSFDRSGKLNFYSARALDKSLYIKYMNSRVEKVSIIFNEININWAKELTIVEGPFDLVKCDENAVPLLGSNLSENSLLLDRIVRHGTDVVLALDADMQKKTHRIATLLNQYGVNVRLLDLAGYDDVGEMPKEVFLRQKESAKQWTPVAGLLHKIDSLSTKRLF